MGNGNDNFSIKALRRSKIINEIPTLFNEPDKKDVIKQGLTE